MTNLERGVAAFINGGVIHLVHRQSGATESVGVDEYARRSREEDFDVRYRVFLTADAASEFAARVVTEN
jgi:hypothetical protein